MEIDVKKIDETYMKIFCDEGVAKQISEEFSFYMKDHFFDPRVRKNKWDGKIRLFNMKTHNMYLGLFEKLKKYCDNEKITINYNQKDFIQPELYGKDFGYHLSEIYKCTNIPHDFQNLIVTNALNSKRGIYKSATSSGKSYAMYIISRYLFSKGLKILILQGTTTLTNQIKKDFDSYSEKQLPIHLVEAGTEKDKEDHIIVSTWQSLWERDDDFFEKYNVVIGDEIHLFDAKCVKSILERCVNASYRFGFTGTLNETKTNLLSLTGVFGPIHDIIDARELIDRGLATEVKIYGILLEHTQEVRNLFKGKNINGKLVKPSWPKEKEIVHENEGRKIFILDMVNKMKGNTLVLFTSIDYGKSLYEMAKTHLSGKEVYLIYGEVSAKDRLEIMEIAENKDDVVIFATYKTLGTGVSIKNLHNAVLSSSFASDYTAIQTIGRTIRLHSSKKYANIYDIGDDTRFKNTSSKNHSLRHFLKRINIYKENKHKVNMYKRSL